MLKHNSWAMTLISDIDSLLRRLNWQRIRQRRALLFLLAGIRDVARTSWHPRHKCLQIKTCCLQEGGKKKKAGWPSPSCCWSPTAGLWALEHIQHCTVISTAPRRLCWRQIQPGMLVYNICLSSKLVQPGSLPCFFYTWRIEIHKDQQTWPAWKLVRSLQICTDLTGLWQSTEEISESI